MGPSGSGKSTLLQCAAGLDLFFGSVASIVVVIPYSIARTDSVLPDTTVGLWAGIAGTAAILTLATSLGAARRAIRAPAVEAVALAA